MLTLAELVKQKRLEDNLSLKRLAEVTGIGYVTVWKIEKRGYTQLTFDTIGKLCDWLEISPRELRDIVEVSKSV